MVCLSEFCSPVPTSLQHHPSLATLASFRLRSFPLNTIAMVRFTAAFFALSTLLSMAVASPVPSGNLEKRITHSGRVSSRHGASPHTLRL